METNEQSRTTAALTGLILDLYTRQLAMMDIIRSRDPKNPDDPEGVEKAEKIMQLSMVKARAHLDRIPILASLRNQPDAQQLEFVERTLKTILFPK
jgi:hypothetical protein